MSMKGTLQFSGVLLLAVLAGLLGVQGTWALWSAQVPVNAGMVQAADFRVELNGTPMVTNGVEANVALTNPTQRLSPTAPVYAEVTIANVTNASAPFTIEATLGTGNVSSAGLIVESAAAGSASCAAVSYTATSSAQIGKAGSTKFCVRISIPAGAGAELENTTAIVTIPVNAAQI